MKSSKNLLGPLWINCLLALGVGFTSLTASAALIEYDLTSLGGNNYQYDYTVTNTGTVTAIDEFTIYFDLGLFANIQSVAAPTGWDPLAIQPDAALSADGFFDGLALSAPLFNGESIGGFSVRFEWLGATGSLPGSQEFDIVDPFTFASLFSGNTVAAQVSGAVSSPATFSIILLGLAMLGCRRFRSKTQTITAVTS